MGTVYKLKRSQPCVTDKINTSRARSSGFGWTSSNWSGYAVTGRKGSFKRISGEWIVPYVKPTFKPAYSSAWIGIDGFKNSSLIQTGTAHESVNGIVRYYPWWEILPAMETTIPLPVSPGDRMQAAITKISRSKWRIQLRNLSRQWTFRTVQTYTGPHRSAEWIMEAPQVGGVVAEIAKVSPTRFSRCRINGKSPKLLPVNGGMMIQDRVKVAVPSYPNACGDAFVVTRLYRNGPHSVYSRNPLLIRS